MSNFKHLFFFDKSGSVENYALFIAEDDGSPDADFPCLEPKEVVGKFGFTSLALVRAANPSKETKKETETAKAIDPPSAEKKEDRGAILESTDYHSFKGFLLHKVRSKTEIVLGNKKLDIKRLLQFFKLFLSY